MQLDPLQTAAMTKCRDELRNGRKSVVMRRAFRTSCFKIDSIVAATSASKARYRTYLSASEVFMNVKITDIRVVRAPEHDEWAAVDETNHPWGEAYLPTSKKAL